MRAGGLLAMLALVAGAGLASAGEVEDLLARAQQGDRAALPALRMRLTETPASAAEVERVVQGYRDAAVKGDVRAQFEFGFLLEQGLGLPRDFRQAESWYRKAAEQGYVEAQYRLGRMYHEGEAIGADRAQAYVWLSVAAGAGSRPAAALLPRAAATLAPGDLKKAAAQVENLREQLAAKAAAH
jgi:hypothetical protein